MATPQVTETNTTTNTTIPNTQDPPTLRIMTYNCLGLKYISKHRRARLAEIGHAIAHLSPPPHIVGLQECWTQEDYASIRSSTHKLLPYGKFYYSGIFGGGLAILSAWPIEESSMFRYPLNGRPTAFFRGDWFVGKGVACARIRMPLSGAEESFVERGGRRGKGSGEDDTIIEVFCTHLHAPYEADPGDSYLCHRTAQAWEIARLMKGAAERGHLVLGLGDFNMLPLSLAHRVIITRGGVVDAWRVLHPDSSIGPATLPAERERVGGKIPTAEFNLEVNGAASDNVLNTWRWGKARQKAQYRRHLTWKEESPTLETLVPMTTPDPHAKRLDYIFIGGNRGGGDGAINAEWSIANMHVGMTHLHPKIHCSLSDHFSIHATLTLSPAPAPHPHPPPVSPSNPIESIYPPLLLLLKTYTAREHLQRTLRLSHFALWLFIALACFVGIWFSPRAWVSFLLMVLSTVGFAGGVVDGLIGGLFMSSELRALRELGWEVRNALEREEGG